MSASSRPAATRATSFCAITCVAADKLGRKWVGIDISPKAVELVNMRLQQSMDSLFHHGYVTARTDIPHRTDIEAPIPYRQNKHVLFGQQEGLCNGCRGDFPFKLFEVDHRCPTLAAALTTWITCNCSAQAATGSRATGPTSAWWRGWRRLGIKEKRHECTNA